MTTLTLTREIAWAAGADKANKHMRDAGRTAWNAEDYDAACVEFNRLIPPYRGDLFTFGHAWRDGSCKWCGIEGSRIDDNAQEVCPG
jgi:hypothetical protein